MAKKQNPKIEETLADMGHMEINQIDLNPENPRVERSLAEDVEFFENVKAQGVHTPIMVRPLGGRYQIVYGHRRFEAQKASGRKTIPCTIRELTDAEALEVAVVENMSRLDINPADEIMAVARLVKSGAGTGHISARLGKSVGWVAKRRNIVDMGDGIVDMIRRGALSVGHAEELCKVSSNPSTMYKFAKFCETAKWTVTALRSAIENEMRDLSTAPFSKVAVCGDLGPCSRCHSRSDKQEDMFDDGDSRKMCLDSACWEKKLTAHIEGIKADLKTEEKVLTNESEWAVQNGSCGYLVEGRDIEKIQKMKDLGVQPRVMVNDETGEVTEHYNLNDMPADQEEAEEPEEDTEEQKQRKAQKAFKELAMDKVASSMDKITLSSIVPAVLEVLRAETGYSALDRLMEKTDDAESMMDLNLSETEAKNTLVMFIADRMLGNKNDSVEFLKAVGIDHMKLMKSAIKNASEAGNE